MEGLAPRPRHATGHRGDRAGRLLRRDPGAPRQDLALLPEGRAIPGARGGARRRDAGLRGGLHLRRRPAAAVPRPLPRRPPAGPLGRLGHPRASLVPRGPGTCRAPRGLAPLDPPRPGLERHVLRLPLHGGPQAIRPGVRHLRDLLVGGERGLRGLPRAGLAPRALGRPAGHGAPAHRERRPRHPHRSPHARGAGRALRTVPLPAGPVRRPHRSRRRAARPLAPHAAVARRVPRRRADPGRGLRVARLHPEQDARLRGALHRLPRRPLREAAAGGQRPLHRLPPRRHLRRRRAPLPPPRVEGEAQRGRPVRLLPHARQGVHGGPLPARPLDAGAPPGPVGVDRRPQRLQRGRMPRRPPARLGAGALRRVVREEAQAPLRDGPRRRPGPRPRGGPRARPAGPGPAAPGGGPGDGGGAARKCRRRRAPRRDGTGARRPRPAPAGDRRRAPDRGRPGGPGPAPRTPSSRPGAGGAHGRSGAAGRSPLPAPLRDPAHRLERRACGVRGRPAPHGRPPLRPLQPRQPVHRPGAQRRRRALVPARDRARRAARARPGEPGLPARPHGPGGGGRVRAAHRPRAESGAGRHRLRPGAPARGAGGPPRRREGAPGGPGGRPEPRPGRLQPGRAGGRAEPPGGGPAGTAGRARRPRHLALRRGARLLPGAVR